MFCFQGFFSQVGETTLSLTLGENCTVYLQKGMKKLDINSYLGENCMILKYFSSGKQRYNSPCYRRKKKLWFCTINGIIKCYCYVIVFMFFDVDIINKLSENAHQLNLTN
jgi:hypothetical protein